MSKPQKGYVLISVLVIMMVMLIITFFLADALFSELSIARNQKAGGITFHLAEAGVQEAIWKIQYDTNAKNTFLNSTDGLTQFTHDNPALLSGGSYTTLIQNTAKATAIITSTGYYAFGSKTAQRKIVVHVTKATGPPLYNYDAAIFSGGSQGVEDLTFRGTNLTVHGGSILSSRNIELTQNAQLAIEKDVKSNGKISICNGCSITAGGIIQENASDSYLMPQIDITSDDPGSLKSMAKSQNPSAYYTSQQFTNLLNANQNLTLNGYIFVDGPVNIVNDQTLTINGILAANGTVNIGATNSNGTLIVNDVNPSGLVSTADIVVDKLGQLTLSGLIYTGNFFKVNESNTLPVNITGGILVRWQRMEKRTVTITFNSDFINRALGNPQDTPVIQIQHWEEEY